jgi:hypothetical protein
MREGEKGKANETEESRGFPRIKGGMQDRKENERQKTK